MKTVYPAFIKPDVDVFLVFIPDLEIYTQGHDFYDAIEMARDAIGLKIVSLEDAGESVPAPSDAAMAKMEVLKDADEEFDFSNSRLTFIDINTKRYRNKLNNRAVKKNCTIPAWLNDKAEEQGINFSRVLQEALIAILG